MNNLREEQDQDLTGGDLAILACVAVVIVGLCIVVARWVW